MAPNSFRFSAGTMPHVALHQRAAATALDAFDEGSVANVLELSGTVDPAVQIAGNHAQPVEETRLVQALHAFKDGSLASVLQQPHGLSRTVDPAVEITGNLQPPVGKTPPVQALLVTGRVRPSNNDVHACCFYVGVAQTEAIAHRALLYARGACYPIFVTASLSAAGILLFTTITPEDHGWHNIAFEAIRISFVSLEACLHVTSKMNEDEGSQDLLMKLVDMLINNKRFWDSVRQTAHSPLDAQTIFHLVGNGLPVLSGACQVLSMAYYQAGIKFIPEVAERFREACRVSEQATRVVESGLSVTIRAFNDRWVAFTARIRSKKAEWFRKIRRVSARGEDQAAAGAMEMQGYGGGDAGQQEADEGV